MPRYRKKPVEIDAAQFTGDNVAETLAFMDAHGGGGWSVTPPSADTDGRVIGMTTIHGDDAFARTGDWIIPERQAGRFYPISATDFTNNYEPVEEAT